METGMCPWCGKDVVIVHSLTVDHLVGGTKCAGSGQNARCAESDARPLWSGKPNLRFRGGDVDDE